jgi:hypothetical protein
MLAVVVLLDWKMAGRSRTRRGRKHIRLAQIMAVNVSRTLHIITSTLSSVGRISIPGAC